MLEILKAMDSLLAGCEERAEEAKHWIMPQESWVRLARAVTNGDIADRSLFGTNTYRTVPVHFGDLGQGRIVGLVSGPLDDVAVSEW